MKKVITYGTYDLLHYGHIRLLERAKALGDYLIVGVTSDAYDRERGKINGTQSVLERIQAIKNTGLADKIILEEYDGQKIDDIKKYNVDIFAIGSDWEGKFDYLNDYCKVVYLPRTQGVSSSEIRTENKKISIGIKGESTLTYKFRNECNFVNGVTVSGLCYDGELENKDSIKLFGFVTNDYEKLLNKSDAVYIVSHPSKHYVDVKKALENGKHVICESPITLDLNQLDELENIAKEKHLILMDSIKTAYSLAYQRLIVLLQSGKIGDIVSVDATCTSLKNYDMSNKEMLKSHWGSFSAWGPTALLPIFQLLGCNEKSKDIICKIGNEEANFDTFTKITFLYDKALASLKVGNGVKSEGELIVSGTKGYAYIPAPWWKTEYFEIRFENLNDMKRYYYKIDGEGIRYEIIAFINLILTNGENAYIDEKITKKIVEIASQIRQKKYIKI